MARPDFRPDGPPESSPRLQELAAAGLLKARPWDVIGVALAAPMLVWGLLGWFGTVGDSGGGVPGFSTGAGAVGIGLVLVAAALTLNQVVSGRAHTSSAPPVAVLISGIAVLLILGGMLAKQDSATIESGSVAGLLTAITQCAVLVVGWVKGSRKVVNAARVAELQARQQTADELAARRGQPNAFPQGPPPAGYPLTGTYPPPNYPPPNYPPPNYPPPNYAPPTYPRGTYPQGAVPPAYPQNAYPQNAYPPNGTPSTSPPPNSPGYPPQRRPG
ncbi:hypothetical protein M6D93_16305 [Jatrophihabitans telluris]|uniref:Uncharacterized protein n=1 Tax=Jatrophihabitans telluris TaxID=2038343 RepID=A0ABY4QWG7_9ACTN|nr:hypothetical protein [Jatrophihabitans telluris]UQX87850.1 hypothetical protein M6D93_16305 [Jatrophihabitans telluris]